MDEVVAYFIKTKLDITRNFRFKLAAYKRFLMSVKDSGRVSNELTIGASNVGQSDARVFN